MRLCRSSAATMGGKIAALAVSVLALPLIHGGYTASADPVLDSDEPIVRAAAADGSTLTRIESMTLGGVQVAALYVHSTAMDREIPVIVSRPKDTSVPRPTLYLLNGAGGGEDSAAWWSKTDAMKFFADKNVNVVIPVGGKWSYYTDWKQDDPVLGANKWETFLTKELPPIVDAALGTNGVNSLAGISSSGTSVLQLAINSKGLYRGVAAYSGCAQTSDPIGQQFVKLTVETWGKGNTENMWGPVNDPAWAANDPYLHAEGLRGLDLYISNGSGIPGPHDTLDHSDIDGQPDVLANQIVTGGIIEAATNYCTHNLANRLNDLAIPATYNLRETGSHSWGYWEDDLKDSWPVLANSLGG